MNKLTKKQEKLLDKWYEENKWDIQVGIRVFDWRWSCSKFTNDFCNRLKTIKNIENLTDEINNYIRTKSLKEKEYLYWWNKD